MRAYSERVRASNGLAPSRWWAAIAASTWPAASDHLDVVAASKPRWDAADPRQTTGWGAVKATMWPA
jgi:hypothetical protein